MSYITSAERLGREKGRKMGIEIGKALNIGIDEGIKIAVEQGIQIGIEQGITKAQVAIARELLKEERDSAFVARITGISLDIIDCIREQNNKSAC